MPSITHSSIFVPPETVVKLNANLVIYENEKFFLIKMYLNP